MRKTKLSPEAGLFVEIFSILGRGRKYDSSGIASRLSYSEIRRELESMDIPFFCKSINIFVHLDEHYCSVYNEYVISRISKEAKRNSWQK